MLHFIPTHNNPRNASPSTAPMGYRPPGTVHVERAASLGLGVPSLDLTAFALGGGGFRYDAEAGFSGLAGEWEAGAGLAMGDFGRGDGRDGRRDGERELAVAWEIEEEFRSAGR